MSVDLERIEGKIDRAVAGGTEVSMSLGGVQVKDLGQLLEIAKMMSISGVAVPAHLRGSPGACLAVAMRALRNGFDPFELAEHSYTMKKSQKGSDGRWDDIETIAFDSFVIRAIIDAHAGATGVLRYSFAGEGDEMRCTVTATPKGEKIPLTHVSPTLGELKAARGRNDKGAIKGSPLWDTKPQQQMSYDTGRDFCRRYFPAVLLGWHDRDEMDENVVPDRQVEPPKTSGLRDRLKAPRGDQRGFDHAAITKTIDGEVAKNEPATDPVEETAPVSSSTNQAERRKAGAQDAPVASTTSPVVHSDGASDQSEPVAATADEPIAEPEVGNSPSQETSAKVEGSVDLPSEPSTAYRGPVEPKDGRMYVEYVRQMLEMPGFSEPSNVREWFKSTEQRRLRNEMSNFSDEIRDEAKEIVTAYVRSISKNVGDSQ